MRYGFGVDIGGTTVKIAFFSDDGTCLEKWEIPTRTEENGRQILPDVAEAVAAYLKKGQYAAADILGIGIGVPGAVWEDGTVDGCVHLGWGRFDLCDALEKLTGLLVVAGNDASLAALGECQNGGYRNAVLVTLGTGVGAGIIADGRLLGGVHGAGGEIGHMTVNPLEQTPCSCGKFGCAEQYCSATGVVRLAEKRLAETVYPSVLRGKAFACKDVFAAGAEGDIPAIEALEEAYRYLGMTLANVCCVVDPEIILLGGGVSRAGQPLLEGAKQYFDKFCFHPCRDTKFALATLGNDAGIYGAFALLMQKSS